jgi:hypothetical protein
MTGGNMKSAWLSNRRILDICQILGFHRSPKPGLDKDDQYRRGVLVWRFCIISDRILSLILGVYHSVGNTAIDRHFDEQDVAVKNMTMLHVTMIDHLLRLSGSIIERNQGFSEVTPAMLEETQRIDSELNLVNPSLIIPDDGEPTSYGKLGLQLAFSQLMLWPHLPLLVHSDPDDCYEYNRQTCLQSCRDVISSYVAIRSINQNTRQYQLLDFGAFTAALTIIIGTLGYYGKRYQHPDNSDAVERVMAHLEELSTNDHSDKVSSRGFQILQTLREVAKGNSPPGYPLFDPNSSEDERPSQLNLDIPYFGTICLERRAFADPVQQNPSAALPTTLPSSDVGGQGPSSAWMGLVLDEYSLAHSTNPNAWSGPSSVLDPTAEFWALNPEFTFQPHSMGFFNDDWGMGL